MEGQPNHESNSISWNVPSAPELTFNPSEAREEKARGPGINTALRGTLHQGGWESGVVSGMNAPKAEPTPPQPLPFFARTTPLTKSPHGWSGLAHGTVRTACSLPAAETPSLLCPVPDATCLSPGPGQSPLEPLYSVPRSFSQRPPPNAGNFTHTHLASAQLNSPLHPELPEPEITGSGRKAWVCGSQSHTGGFPWRVSVSPI